MSINHSLGYEIQWIQEIKFIDLYIIKVCKKYSNKQAEKILILIRVLGRFK